MNELETLVYSNFQGVKLRPTFVTGEDQKHEQRFMHTNSLHSNLTFYHLALILSFLTFASATQFISLLVPSYKCLP